MVRACMHHAEELLIVSYGLYAAVRLQRARRIAGAGRCEEALGCFESHVQLISRPVARRNLLYLKESLFAY
jgi:hypothetical protein